MDLFTTKSEWVVPKILVLNIGSTETDCNIQNANKTHVGEDGITSGCS